MVSSFHPQHIAHKKKCIYIHEWRLKIKNHRRKQQKIKKLSFEMGAKNVRIDESENSISEIKHPDSSVIIFVFNAIQTYNMEMFK